MIALSFSSNVLYAVPKKQGESEQIVVRLATESQLILCMFSQFSDNDSGFDAAYLKKLENVLQFDLNHNAMTYTVDQTPDKDAIVSKLSSEAGDSSKSWVSLNAFYALKVNVTKDKKLAVSMFPEMIRQSGM